MIDPTAGHFERLRQGSPEWLSPKLGATMRFDLERDGRIDHWFVGIEQGTVRVSRAEREADCVLYAAKGLFDRVVTGEVSLFAALLRNEISIEGDFRIFAAWRKMLPGPASARDPRAVLSERRRRRSWNS